MYVPETYGWVNVKISQCHTPYKENKRKKTTIISLDAENAFNKTQHLFMINLDRLEMQGPYLSIIKDIYEKLTVDIILKEKNLK